MEVGSKVMLKVDFEITEYFLIKAGAEFYIKEFTSLHNVESADLALTPNGEVVYDYIPLSWLEEVS